MPLDEVLQFKVPSGTNDAIRAIAKKEGSKPGDVLRQIIAEAVAKKGAR